MKELLIIQEKLNAPKNLINSFGGYQYRSCEGILEAVKPLLKEQECTLLLSDSIVAFGERVYVEASAILTNKDGQVATTTASAREAEKKKGMDEAQITGAASSYARKYALNGLFAIDDSKDVDDIDVERNRDKNDTTVRDTAIENIRNAPTIDALAEYWRKSAKYLERNLNFKEWEEIEREKDARKAEFDAAN